MMSNKSLIPNIKISTRGGLIPILKHINSCKIPQAIRSCIKKRPFWSTYMNEDIIIALAMNIFCGKKRIGQIETFRDKLSMIPNLKLPSHDAIGRALKNLKTPTETISNINNVRNAKLVYTEINYNKSLNDMLIKSTKRLELFPSGKSHTLDMDATFISTKCRDAKANTRKKSLGYSPMVCMVDKMPVHISLRSGNAAAAINIKKDFESCYELMTKNNEKIGRVRSDAAGYNKLFLESINDKGIKYNVRMPFFKSNSGLINGLNNCTNWEEVKIETTDQIWECEIGEIPYSMYKSEMKSRIICLKTPDEETISNSSSDEYERIQFVIKKMEALDKKGLLKRKGKLHSDAWANYNGYDYKLIITNDFDTSPKDLMIEYNKRGGSERNFEYLKNDFGWKYPPFMCLNENNVYLIVTALINNIFISALSNFNKYVKGLRHNCRLQLFIDVFVEVGCVIFENGQVKFYVDESKYNFQKFC